MVNKKEENSPNNNWEKVTRIFDPVGGGSDFLVARMLTVGLITYTVEKISLQHPKTLAIVPRGSVNETDLHLILKYNACLLLKELGEKEPHIEQKGYDVYSPKLRIRIECGPTEPDRLTWSFHGDEVTEFWILQYPKEGDSALLYKFKPSKGCKNKLRAYFSDMNRNRL